MFHPADERGFVYSSAIETTLIVSPADPERKAMRFARPLDSGANGYGKHDNPGARIAFRTASSRVQAVLYYNGLHARNASRNPNGAFFIDGETRPEFTYTAPTDKADKTGLCRVTLPVPATPGEHTYEIILPYGDSVDFLGAELSAGATLAALETTRKPRCLFYGDSVTHGFTATNVRATYAFRLAQAMRWEPVNCAVGGRSSLPPDAAPLMKIDCDLFWVAIGVNDWQSGRSPQEYGERMRSFLKICRVAKPKTPFVVLTPLWVHEDWKPQQAKFALEEYRQTLRALVAELADPALLLIEGTELTDHDKSKFDPVLVHPNDAGFAQMAERLAQKLSVWPPAAFPEFPGRN